MTALHGALVLLALTTVSVNYQNTLDGSETSIVARQQSEWGIFEQLIGSEWLGEHGWRYTFEWEDPDRVLAIYLVDSTGLITERYMTFARDPARGRIEGIWHLVFPQERGVLEVLQDGRTMWLIGTVLPRQREFTVAGDTLTIRETGRLTIPFERSYVRIRGASSDNPATDTPPRNGGSIVIAGTAPLQRVETTLETTVPAPASSPIVIAPAPPSPAPMRESLASQTPAELSPSSREALMQAQVEARRVQAARDAEAERVRLAQVAEQQRQAEARRRAEQAEREGSRSEWLGFAGALVGGVAAGSYSGGDMTAITAGMAAGSAMASPESEAAAAANTVFQDEYRRYEELRAFEQQVIAELHNPDNPLTQQAMADEEARRQAYEADRIDAENREREAREDAALYELERQRASVREAREIQAETDRQQAEEAQRARGLREAEEARQREFEAEERAREAEERRQAVERDRLAREEVQRREAEDRRLEQERLEAQRNRLVDFREAIVICELAGDQAQYGNWTCQGPLQMTYVNFDRPTVASAMNLMSCASYRELPQAGRFRVFGCGYGLHPTNPGALRNVPEMMGVFVDGRATFRCPVSSTDVCRNR